jgi:cysteinyl-tRNA synthetase
LFVDTLRRALVVSRYRVRHVMNITDVGHLTSDQDTGDDKMEQGSLRTGESAWEIAREWTPGLGLAPLMAVRAPARSERRWNDADTLRAQAQALGYDIDDTETGQQARRR